MSSNVDKSADNVQHSKPIPINTRRGRSYSVSDSSSSEESCSPSSPVSPLQSPLTGNAPRIAPLSPGATPILNYFLTHSPAKSPSSATSATFPFRRGFGSAVFDSGTWLSLLTHAETTTSSHDALYFSDDSEPDAVNTTTSKHSRRASTAWAGADRFAPPAPQQQPPQPPVAVPDQSGRAAGLLRRLSLGGAALRVSPDS